MKLFKKDLLLICAACFLWACGSSQINNKQTPKEAPVVIANDSLEYEIIIIDSGFTAFLATVAKPKGFEAEAFIKFSDTKQNYNRNRFFHLLYSLLSLLLSIF